jgi:hypothetical protein
VAALEVWYDQDPENDLGPGDPAIVVRTHAELTELVDKISDASAHQVCPSIVTMYVADDPYGQPSVRAGIGAELGYVQVSGRSGRRVTIGDADASGERTYDFQGHGEQVPRRFEVSLAIVREVLAAYLTHDGSIPQDFTQLRFVD